MGNGMTHTEPVNAPLPKALQRPLQQPLQEPKPAQKGRKLPSPQLQQLDNLTRLPHFQFMDMGLGRVFYDVVVVKASFDLKDGTAVLSRNQAGPSLADVYWNQDNPEFSSLKQAGDTVLYKPFADIFVTGKVSTFQNKPQTSWHGLLRVRRGKAQLINKTLRFSGPRQWTHKSKDVWRLGKPAPTTQVQLQYELAYGGHYIDPAQLKKQHGPDADKDTSQATEICAANPSGTGLFGPVDGFFGSKGSPSHDPSLQYPGPQIEWEDDAITDSSAINFKQYQPAGWGPIARWWSPRVRRQGTYDDAWLKDFYATDIADYPKDFKNTYFNCAPADQMVEGALQGDEFVEMVGVFADRQTLSMQLPGWTLLAHSTDAQGHIMQGQLRLDTLHIDLDAQQLHATWRLSLGHDQRIQSCAIELIKAP